MNTTHNTSDQGPTEVSRKIKNTENTENMPKT